VCGFSGTFAVSGALSEDVRRAIGPMTDRLRHRGPDGGNVFTDSRATLGHRRLAIIDVAGGWQPLTNEDHSCWIVFNGEVYNHHLLRQQLESHGHKFRTKSDTETILHAYEEWGAACVERLEGMFAFAIYDSRRRSLFAARDRLGKKPLFYAVFDGVLHFASEIKSIAASPAWRGNLDLSVLEEYFSLGYILAPRTIYREVFKLEPGHWLKASGGQIEIRRYWDIEQFDCDQRDRGTVLDELDALLATRTRERLESEVPLGAFLSGGIDSGLVVSYMAQAMGRPVETTTVGFDSALHNELESAALTARKYGTTHHEEIIRPDLEEVLDRVAVGFDEPFADASAVPTYYVSAATRRYVTVALSGDGGDEVFGGYPFRYVPHGIEAWIRQLWSGPAARRVSGWFADRWPRSHRLPRGLRLGNVLSNLATDPATAYYQDLCFLRPPETRRLLGLQGAPHQGRAWATISEIYRRCPSPYALQRAQYADLHVYLANDVLVKVDRMSMAHGLEVRAPLLDRRIAEFAFRLPTPVKMPRLSPKHLIRQIARRRLPSELLTMPKHGFTAPIAEWIRGPHSCAFQDEVLTSRSHIAGVLDLHRVKRLFDDHRAGRGDHSYALWATWMLERWWRVGRFTEPVARCVAADVRS
jgi:asparagine synthase (glutamine-hydrolysing)